MSQLFLETGVVVPVTLVSTLEELDQNLENKNIELVGKSKGKGFTGAMKKWGFHGEMATRGQSNKPRSAGSIGGQTPGRVLKGKKMAGRHGNQKVTLKNIKIVKVDSGKKELYVFGPIPGARNSEVKIRVLE